MPFNEGFEPFESGMPAPGATYAFQGQQSNLNLGIGTSFPNGTGGVGQNFTSNVAIGGGRTDGTQPLFGDLGSVTTGYDNVAVGAGVLIEITTGHSNVGVGADVLSFSTPAVSSCTGIGAQALTNNQSDYMTAVGAAALQANTSGTVSVAVGAKALTAQTTGNSNTAVGYQALMTMTTATQNTAVGYNALVLATGSNNTALGSAALGACVGGGSNTAIGRTTLNALTTGNSNTAVGLSALAATNGSSNTAIGQNAGGISSNTTGGTFLGTSAGSAAGGSSDNSYMTLVGFGTIGTGAGAVAIGTDSGGVGASAVGNQIALGTANHHTLWKTAAAPADAALAASQFTLWLDATVGAAKLMVKAKNSAGTVVAATIALA